MNASLVIPTFIPVRARKGCMSEQKKAAAMFRDLICETLTENGPIGARAIAEATGSTVNTVRDYLHDMIHKGLVKSAKVKGRNHPTGGTVMCMYRLAGDDPAEPGPVAVQVIATVYPLHHVRDELVAALFGAPQLQG